MAGRKKNVLSVTVTPDALTALNKFVDDELKAGWATNKSQVVNNAILEFVTKNRARTHVIPSGQFLVDAPEKGKEGI